MNVENFKEYLDLMSHSGFRLTDLEAGLIKNSLIILQSENKLNHMFFFGKISTSHPLDICYYIAFGYITDFFKDQKFFYSTNGFDWVMMPEVKAKYIPTVLQSLNLLTGDPMHVEHVWKMPKFTSDSENVFMPCPRQPKELKEEDRLACLVHLLVTQAAIMPRGYLYRQITRNVTENPCFKGLSRVEVLDMKNFQLVRYPQNNRNYNLTKHEDSNYQTDFFDSIDDVIPKNRCFTFSINHEVCLMIKALHWPGMIFFHKLNTKYHGFVYIGNGKRNLDILFMT